VPKPPKNILLEPNGKVIKPQALFRRRKKDDYGSVRDYSRRRKERTRLNLRYGTFSEKTWKSEEKGKSKK